MITLSASRMQQFIDDTEEDGAFTFSLKWVPAFVKRVNAYETTLLKDITAKYGPAGVMGPMVAANLPANRADRAALLSFDAFQRDFEAKMSKPVGILDDHHRQTYWDTKLAPIEVALANLKKPLPVPPSGATVTTTAPATVPVTTTTTQTQFGPPSPQQPASYGGGGGGSGIPYNAQVAEAQQILTSLGFNPGGVDGKLGNNTRAALIKFQSANGLPATGNLDAATLGKLREKKGSAPGASASAKGMSTGMKVGLALAGAAIIGGGLWFVLKDEEPGVST